MKRTAPLGRPPGFAFVRATHGFLAGLAALSLAALTHTASGAVAFSLAPSTPSNTYNGQSTLRITGLTNTETVVVQEYLDLNANGAVEGTDLLVQQFTLTDGQPGMVIGGVTNFNVAGDTGGTDGVITAALDFQNGGQNFVGKYLYKVSSPGGHFTPLTNPFVVTSFPYPQRLTGTVWSNSASATVPNAVVLLLAGPLPGKSGTGKLLGGVVADAAGNYAFPMPPGTYQPMVFASHYAYNMSAIPTVTLASGQTLVTNLSLTNVTSTLSGTLVDGDNPSIGLPGIAQPAMSTNGLMAFTFSDENGNFTLPATAGPRRLVSANSWQAAHGYLGWDQGTNVTAPASGLALPFWKATAMVHGTVKDNLGNPLSGIFVECSDDKGFANTETYTDINGNYVVGARGGLSNDLWKVEVDQESSPASYVYSYPVLSSISLNAGQAVQVNFTAIPASNHISGSLKDNLGNPIPGVGIWANAMINGTFYHVWSVDTDTNGNYSLVVGPGSWGVGGFVNLPGTYLPPADQNVVISNSDGVANFVATRAGQQITGWVKDGNGQPAAGVPVIAQNSNFEMTAVGYADANGNYTLYVTSGWWQVAVMDEIGKPNSYLGPGWRFVTLSNNAAVVNFTATRATQQITGTVKDRYGNVVSGVRVTASVGREGAYGTVAADANGKYTLYVANATWAVSLTSVPPGHPQPPEQTAVISSNNAIANFVLSPTASLGSPQWLAPGQFQLLLTGITGQNYTVQMSTNLHSTNWTTIFATNSLSTGEVTVLDPNATNAQRFYRLLVGP